MTRIRRPVASKDIDDIRSMVETVSKMLVDRPEEVIVHVAQGEGFYHLEVVCDEDDAGTLIGPRGRHAKAIRLLAMRAAKVRDLRVTVNILSRDQHALAPR